MFVLPICKVSPGFNPAFREGCGKGRPLPSGVMDSGLMAADSAPVIRRQMMLSLPEHVATIRC
ncbi:hypothetical protein RHECNPAF_1240011 [Rhizobium etli CNPAF512]|nr:hypothetical protein RHECNPAF_1240011 [Rhizobium etli CNPAF512]